MFFSTEESVAAPFVVHGSFDLAANRKHLRPGANDEALLRTLGEMAGTLATNLPPESVIELFGPVPSRVVWKFG